MGRLGRVVVLLIGTGRVLVVLIWTRAKPQISSHFSKTNEKMKKKTWKMEKHETTRHNSHTLHTRKTSSLPTLLIVFPLFSCAVFAVIVTKTVLVEKPVHRARCQRCWAGPPAHGAAANQPGPRDRGPPTMYETSVNTAMSM